MQPNHPVRTIQPDRPADSSNSNTSNNYGRSVSHSFSVISPGFSMGAVPEAAPLALTATNSNNAFRRTLSSSMTLAPVFSSDMGAADHSHGWTMFDDSISNMASSATAAPASSSTSSSTSSLPANISSSFYDPLAFTLTRSLSNMSDGPLLVPTMSSMSNDLSLGIPTVPFHGSLSASAAKIEGCKPAMAEASCAVVVNTSFVESLFHSGDWKYSDASTSNRNVAFAVRTKREDTWHSDFPARLFWTSHYVVRIAVRASAVTSSTLDASLVLVHAESLAPIMPPISGTVDHAPLESAQGGAVFMGELSVHFHTHSHAQNNAPFRIRCTLSNGVEAFSPPFRVLARRPANDGSTRVYGNHGGMVREGGHGDDMEEMPRKKMPRTAKMEAFLEDPKGLSAQERLEVVNSFAHAMKSLPAAEKSVLLNALQRHA